MSKNKIALLLISFFSLQMIWGQKPQKLNSAEIYNQIQKLNFLGSVLYIAAHPDDENTKLISYLSNEKKARTAYLSLTRGDGGQNLIGPELRELLGVIRTQELIEARKIDGGEQFFSRANDFGYSKNPKETLKTWDKKQVLSDVVWIIRKFQPDVIINRFDHRTSGNTHGHHSASALLSVESFDLTNSTKAFPEQLQFVTPWQVKRQFFNPSWWFYGSQEKYNNADKSNFSSLPIGVFYPNLGKSNSEIAALSRSSHQSQGFGSTGSRGQETEYLELINGTPLKDKSNIFEGIDTSWNRVSGGKIIGELLSEIISKYDFNEPSASIPDLIKVYQKIQLLEDTHWKTIKSEELKDCIANCAGLYLEAVSNTQKVTKESVLNLRIEAINRSNTKIELVSLISLPEQKEIIQNKPLTNNVGIKFNIDFQIPKTIEYTQPYWLKEKGTIGMYAVTDQKNIGIPDIIRETKIIFNINFNGVTIPFKRNLVYKNNDPVKGEIYQFVDIIPEVTSTIMNNVILFNNNKSKTIGVKVKSGIANFKGELALDLPKNWLVFPEKIPFELNKTKIEQLFYFRVTPPSQTSEVYAKSIVTVNDERYSIEQINIEYPHITKQQVLKSAEAKFIKSDIKIDSLKIGYIMGAGDAIPESLIQMGCDLTLLNPEEISAKYLAPYDVIITGIRAYNTVEGLANKQSILFDFVKGGKTMLVQYNTPRLLPNTQLAPYPLKISSDRVTEENAKVRFLSPEHAVLNYPNKITEDDFKGWTQEQGLYFPNEYDSAFTPILSSNDTDESPNNGALLIAAYGKGYYIYTGLSFFRELPEGVTGAYRLMANLISLKNNPIETEQNKP